MKKALLAVVLLVPALAAWGQGGDKQLPMTNGTAQTRMDAPEKNSELETYTRSRMVQRLGRVMGVSTPTAARIFEDFNSGVLLAVVLYFLLKFVPGKLRAKRQQVDRELAEARVATADAEQRLSRVEAQTQSLGGEIEALRRDAREGLQAEHIRMQATLEEEKGRIVRQAESEISAAQANAERGLRQFVADAAVARAAERVKLTPETDQAMVDGFLRELAGQLGQQGRN